MFFYMPVYKTSLQSYLVAQVSNLRSSVDLKLKGFDFCEKKQFLDLTLSIFSLLIIDQILHWQSQLNLTRNQKSGKVFKIRNTGAVFATPHFLRNLQLDPVS